MFRIKPIPTDLLFFGIGFPNYLIHSACRDEESTRVVGSLSPGVTELYIHPAKESDTLKRMTNRWQVRVDEYHLFKNDPEILKVLEENGVKLIGWRALRDLQRSNEGSGPGRTPEARVGNGARLLA